MARPNERSSTRIALAAGLFFLSPLIAEFLLGDLPIKMLPALIVLAPMYGGGTLFIREVTRRTRRGWPTIIVLALTYAIFEEAFTTQTLFNPNYLSLNLHLLAPAYIPALGIGAWWTLFVLTLHTAWSVSTSIALVEALAPASATTPWLGRTGLTITALLFAFGIVSTTLIGYRQDHFLASTIQLVSAAIICVVLVVIAFRIPQGRVTSARGVPSLWVTGAFTLAAGSAVLLIPKQWGWWAAVGILVLDLGVLAAVLIWSRSSAWNMRHKLGLASGAALAYAWHAFIQTPAVGHATFAVRVGNTVFALGAVALIAEAAARTRRATPDYVGSAQDALSHRP